MAIEKLTEFAQTGQKDTDQLDLEVGFIVNRKPARQWFNWLFNTLTTKINEIIDADFMPKSDVIDNLTTNDATKPVSAKQAKLLQDNKLDANKRGAVSGVASLDENKKVPVAELPLATSSVAGVMKLINSLTTGGTDAALAAEAMKTLVDMFSSGTNHFRVPRKDSNNPWIVQFNYVSGVPSGVDETRPYNFNFPNAAVALFLSNASLGNSSNNSIQGRVSGTSNYRLRIKAVGTDSPNDYYWLAIGY